MKSTVFSFDVFDTCLVRTFAWPEDLFIALAQTALPKLTSSETIAEFATARIQAETAARRAARCEEITLVAIYRQFEALGLGYWQLQPLVVMAAEVSLEIGCVRPVRVIQQRIARLKKQGKRVIFISDMYLPQSVIRLMLVNHGLAAPTDPIYVSSDIGLTKQTGHLFNHVLQQENLQPDQLWHTGDNPRGDVTVPRRLGIKTTYFRQSRLNRYERLIKAQPNSQPLHLSQLAGISRAVRVQFSDANINGELVKLVADIIAPLLVGFVAWVLNESEKNGIERLYFVSRDGQILHKIAQILTKYTPAPECRYLYGSRQAWFLPAVQDVDRANLDWLTLHSRAPRHLFKKLNLTPEEVSDIFPEQGFFDWDTQLNETSVERFWQVIEHPEIKNLILKRASEAYSVTLDYFEQEGLTDSAKWSLVDVGWTLKSQRAVNQILQANSVTDIVYGYYLGISKERVSVADSGPYSAYLLESTLDESTDLPVNALFRNMGMIEQVFTIADHGSVIGYEYDKHKIEPVLINLPPWPQREQFVATLHKVVLAYAEELARTNLLNDINSLKHTSLLTLKEFLSKPVRNEVQSIAWIPIGEDQNEMRRHQLARKLTIKDVFYYAGRAFKTSKVRDYSAGHSWWAGSIVLSGFWIRILFSLAFWALKFRRQGGFLRIRRLWWKLTGTDTL